MAFYSKKQILEMLKDIKDDDKVEFISNNNAMSIKDSEIKDITVNKYNGVFTEKTHLISSCKKKICKIYFI